MATTHPTQVRIENDPIRSRSVVLLAAYAGGIILTMTVATATAAVLVGFTAGLGQFVLVAAGWLVLVSAAPELSKRATIALGDVAFERRAPRTSRAVTAALAYVLAKRARPAGR